MNRCMAKTWTALGMGGRVNLGKREVRQLMFLCSLSILVPAPQQPQGLCQ